MEKLSRLQQAVDFLRNSGKIKRQQDIAERVGIAQSHISDALKGGKYFTSGFLRRFAAAYSDYISEAWLLEGTGRMERADRATTRPHIPADRAMVAAGPMGVAIGSVTEDECEPAPLMRSWPAYDFTIEVHGDSMFPTLHGGDVIACRWLEQGAEFRADRIYVLDTPEGAVVKRVTDTGAALLCHSDNEAFTDYTLPKDPRTHAALVVAATRFFD